MADIEEFIPQQELDKGNEFRGIVQGLTSDLVPLIKNAREAANSLMSVNTNGQLTKGFNEAATAQNKLAVSYDKIIEQQEKARLAEVKLQQARQKAFDDNDKKIARQAAAQEKAARAEEKLNFDAANSYGILSKAYNDAALAAKNYQLNLGKNSPIAIQATADAKALGEQLKALDASVGQNQRNVGNYSSVLTGYANTLRGLRGPTKLLGEALGFGAQEADQFRIVLEHSIQGFAAYFRGKEAKAEAEATDTAATTTNTAATTANTVANEANAVSKKSVAIANDLAIEAEEAFIEAEINYDAVITAGLEKMTAQTFALQEVILVKTELAVSNEAVIASELQLTEMQAAGAVSAEAYVAAEGQLAAAKTVNTALTESLAVAEGQLVVANEAAAITMQAEAIASEELNVARAAAIATAETATVAEEQLAAATVAATGAQTGLRIALIATGIGAIIALIGLAVFAYQQWRESTEAQRLAQEALKKSLDDTNYKEAISNVQELTENIKLAKQGFIDKNAVIELYNKSIGEAAGKVTTLNGVETGLIENKDAYIQMMREKAYATQLLKESTDKYIKSQQAAESLTESPDVIDYFTAAAPGSSLTPQAAATLRRLKEAEEAQKASDKLLGIYKEVNDKEAAASKAAGLDNTLNGKIAPGSVAALRQEISLLKEKIDTEGVANKQRVADTKQLIILEAQLKAIEGHEPKPKKTKINDTTSGELKGLAMLTDARTEYLKQQELAQEESNKVIYEDTQTSLKLRLSAYDAYVNEQINLVGLDSAKEEAIVRQKLDAITKAEGTSKDKRSKFQTDLIQQRQALELQLQTLEQKRIASIATINTKGAKDIENIRKQASQQAIQQEQQDVSEGLVIISKQYAEERSLLDFKHTEHLISEKSYKDQLKQLAIDEAGDAIQYQLEQLQVLLDSNKLSIKDTEETKKKIADLNTQYNKIGKAGNTNTESDILNIGDKGKADLKNFEIYAQTAITIANGINDVLDQISAKRRQQTQLEIDAIDKRNKTEIDGINESKGSQEEKDAAIKESNAKADAQKQQLAEKQKSRDIRDAQRQKAIKLAEIIVSTSLAVVHQLESGDPYTAIARAIAAGAVGAAEFAVAAATPIPSFEQGGIMQKDGLARHTEGNKSEIILEPGKLPRVTSRETIEPLKRGTRIIPNHKIMQFYGSLSPQLMSSMTVQKNDNADVVRQLTKLNGYNERQLAELRNKPSRPTRSIFGSGNNNWVNS